jgi:hypothetical protein
VVMLVLVIVMVMVHGGDGCDESEWTMVMSSIRVKTTKTKMVYNLPP